MKEEPPAKRSLRLGKLWWWMVVVFAALIGWQMWKLNAYNNAVREAKEAGFEWRCEDAISLIRQDWRNALKKETWGKHERVLNMKEVPDLGRYREMLHQLRPTELSAGECKDENLDALKGLISLQTLHLINCPALKNVDGLKSFISLKEISLNGCTALQNVDGLKSLTGLQEIWLLGCTQIPAAVLRELCAALPKTKIIFFDPPQ